MSMMTEQIETMAARNCRSKKTGDRENIRTVLVYRIRIEKDALD